MWDSTASSVTTRLNAVRLGIFAGIFTCLAYPLLVFLPLPRVATAALAACIGPALGLASYGLKTLLDLERSTVSSALGLLLNSLAGAMFSAMLLVQLAVKALAQDQKVAPPLAGFWLGCGVGCLCGPGNAFLCRRHVAAPSLRAGVRLLGAGYRRQPAGA
jgi:hypothetical protein